MITGTVRASGNGGCHLEENLKRQPGTMPLYQFAYFRAALFFTPGFIDISTDIFEHGRSLLVWYEVALVARVAMDGNR
jgi:hypothetical protein